jgi:hypothetical protein
MLVAHSTFRRIHDSTRRSLAGRRGCTRRNR